MPAAKMCVIPTVSFCQPAGKHSYLLLSAALRDRLENIPILRYVCVQTIITSLLPNPQKWL